MRQTIKTIYKGPTNTRGERMLADCESMRIAVPYDYSLDIEGNHRAAAEALLERQHWSADNRIVGGGWFGDSMFWILKGNDE